MPRISSLEEFSELPSLIFSKLFFYLLLCNFTFMFCKWFVYYLIGFNQPNRDDDDDDDDGTVTDNLSSMRSSLFETD